MKRLIFIILKILEITAFIFVPYFTGRAFFLLAEVPQHFSIDWLMGLLFTILAILIGGLLFLFVTVSLPNFIKLNKEWAEKIHNRLKSPSGGE